MGFLEALSRALWSHQPQWELSHSVNWIYSKLSAWPFWESCCPQPECGDEVARKDFVAFKAPFLMALKCSWGARPWGWSACREGRDSALGLPWVKATGPAVVIAHCARRGGCSGKSHGSNVPPRPERQPVRSATSEGFPGQLGEPLSSVLSECQRVSSALLQFFTG